MEAEPDDLDCSERHGEGPGLEMVRVAGALEEALLVGMVAAAVAGVVLVVGDEARLLG